MQQAKQRDLQAIFNSVTNTQIEIERPKRAQSSINQKRLRPKRLKKKLQTSKDNFAA